MICKEQDNFCQLTTVKGFHLKWKCYMFSKKVKLCWVSNGRCSMFEKRTKCPGAKTALALSFHASDLCKKLSLIDYCTLNLRPRFNYH